MIKRSAFVKIETLAERGVFQKDIAQELGLSDRTVRRALRRGGPHVLLERMKLEHLETRLDAICEGATQREMNYREFLAETLETEWSGRSPDRKANCPGRQVVTDPARAQRKEATRNVDRLFGDSSTRARTWNLPVNSRLLYH